MDRNTSIDVLKCIAAMAVLNSHMEILYGDYSYLATGGAIGDALFFFCSGFTLFLGRNASFFNWYKRRINRIYPTVFVSVLLCTILKYGEWDRANFLMTLTMGGGWFVACIMIYYAILWFVKTYMINRLKWVYGFTVIAIMLWYYTVGIDASNHNMYSGCYFKWVHFFLSMLLGATIGLKSLCESKVSSSVWYILLKLICCVMFFYGLCYFKFKNGFYDYLQMLSLVPLAGVVYSFYELCSTNEASKIYKSKLGCVFIRTVGGLCLEIYLIQNLIFSDVLNFMFPLNIPVFFVLIVCSAYLLRCGARIWSQTFKDEDYNWREIVKLY